MSRRLLVFGLTALIIALPLWAWSLDTSPEEILRNPDRFDGKLVTLNGTMASLKTRVSQKDNPYYTFALEPGGRGLTVFSFGQPPCRDGSPVRVEGVFQKVKRQGRYTFHNQVDATSVTCR